jgi:hypothetical protein
MTSVYMPFVDELTHGYVGIVLREPGNTGLQAVMASA